MAVKQKKLLERYANSLYELSLENKVLDKVTIDLGNFIKIVDNSKELELIIRSPILSKDKQNQIIQGVLEKLKFNDITKKFFGTLINNGRLYEITNIISVFLYEVSRRKGEVTIDVISAIELDNDSKNKIKDLSSKLTNSKKLFINTKIDKDLIGGLVISIGSKLIDASVRTKLNRLEAEMKGII